MQEAQFGDGVAGSSAARDGAVQRIVRIGAASPTPSRDPGRVARAVRPEPDRRRVQAGGAVVACSCSPSPCKRRRLRYLRRFRPGSGTVPLQSNRNPAGRWTREHRGHILCDVPPRAARARGPPTRAPQRSGSPPSPPSRRAPGSAVPATPWPARSGSSGALLGQVIAEQAGPELFAVVERLRRRTIALRRGDDPLTPDAHEAERDRLMRRAARPRHGRARPRSRRRSRSTSSWSTSRRSGSGSATLRSRARRARGRGIDESLREAVDVLRADHDRGRGPRRSWAGRSSTPC